MDGMWRAICRAEERACHLLIAAISAAALVMMVISIMVMVTLYWICATYICSRCTTGRIKYSFAMG